MAEWFCQYWTYALGLVGACIVLFFALRAAVKASAEHRKSYKAEEEYITRLKALKEKYVPLTKEAVASAPENELLEGASLGIQLFLQKQEDMEKAFLSLPDEKKLIYTLDVFVSDKTASAFFRNNSQILKSRLVPALFLVGLEEQARRIVPVSKMFDDKDEETSLDNDAVERLDKELESEEILSFIKLSAAKYIKDNEELFVER